MNTKQMNIQVLALLGDAVYSLYIREELIKLGVNNSDKLQKMSINYVSAKSQAKLLEEFINKGILNDEEMDVVMRGRNNKKEYHPKNTDIMTYKLSTGFEALLGDLYLNNRDRLNEILGYIEVFK